MTPATLRGTTRHLLASLYRLRTVGLNAEWLMQRKTVSDLSKKKWRGRESKQKVCFI